MQALKITLFTLALTVLFLYSKSQNTPVEQWVNTTTGSYSFSELATCSVRDNLGNTFIAGEGASSSYIAKFDNTGVVVKEYQYVDSNNTMVVPKIIQVDATGNIYMGGLKFYDGYYRIAFVKFNAAGDVLWENEYNTFYGASPAEAWTVDNPSSPTTIAYTGRVNDSLFVGKFSLTGNFFAWNNKVIPIPGTYSNAWGLDVKINGGNIYVAGRAGTPLLQYDALIIKFNGAGSQMYANTINGSASLNDYAAKVVVNSSGEAIIYGTLQNSTNDFFISKFNSVGGVVYTTSFSPPLGETVQQPMDLVFNSTSTLLYTLGRTSDMSSSFNGYYNVFNPSTGMSNYQEVVDGGSYELVHKIHVDNFDNFYITGETGGEVFLRKYNNSFAWLYSASYSPAGNTFVNSHLDNSGNIYFVERASGSLLTGNNTLLIKYNTLCTYQWEAYHDVIASSNNQNYGLLLDAYGNVVQIGGSRNSGTEQDAHVTKYNANGTLIWKNDLDFGSVDNYLLGFDQDGNNNVFTAVYGTSGDVFVTKMDPSGNVLYTANMGLKNDGFAADSSGNFYIGGTNLMGRENFDYGKFGFLGTPIWTTTTIPGALLMEVRLSKIKTDSDENVYGAGLKGISARSIYVEKTDASGNFVWGTLLTGYDSTLTYFNGVKKIDFDAAGNIIVLANVFTYGGQDAMLLAKLNPITGSIIYKTIYNGGTGRLQNGNDFCINAANEVLVAGIYLNTSSPFTVYAIVEKFNTAGSLVWEYEDPTGSSADHFDVFSAIGKDAQGNYVASGTIYEQTGPSSFFTNVRTTKLDDAGTSIWRRIYEPVYKGSASVTGLALFNNRVYVGGLALMDAGTAEDILLLKYCDNMAPDIIEPSPIIVCNGTTVPLNVGGSYTSYLWQPTGEMGHGINVTSSGDYWMIGTEEDGCSKISDTVTVNIKAIPTTPDICMVTVDSLSTHNIIYWDKLGYTDVSYFVIYREDVTNIYTPVGSVPFDSLSEYHDFGANPNITTKRYKISAVDTCGSESLKSNYHNTLYVTDNGSGDFSWNLYEIESSPNPVTTFELLRDDNGTGVWNVIGTTAGTQQILSDPSYSSFPDGEWYVRTVWGITCTPTRAGVSTSRSNVRTKSMIGNVPNLTSDNAITTYPNPAGSNLTVEFILQDQTSTTVYLKDAVGRLIDEQTSNNGKVNFNTSSLERGTYFVEINYSGTKLVKRVIKE